MLLLKLWLLCAVGIVCELVADIAKGPSLLRGLALGNLTTCILGGSGAAESKSGHLPTKAKRKHNSQNVIVGWWWPGWGDACVHE